MDNLTKLKKLQAFLKNKDLAVYETNLELADALHQVLVEKQGLPGKDADENKIIREVLARIPRPKDGISPTVDYEKVIKEVLRKIPRPSPAVVDYDRILLDVLSQIPQPKDGKNGSPDQPFEIKAKLESLKGPERLDASAIKNLPEATQSIIQNLPPMHTELRAGSGIRIGPSGIISATGGSGSGDVVGPTTNNDSYIPQWDGANSKTLKDGLAVPAGGLAGLTALASYLPLSGGTMTGGITNSTSVNPLTTLAESWIGPSSTNGIYFKGNNIGIGTTGPTTKLGVSGEVQIIGTGSPTTGAGIEIRGTTTPYIQAYNRDTSAYLPLNVYGSTFQFNPGVSGSLFVSTTGSVGIGSTAPQTKLALASGSAISFEASAGVTDIALTHTTDTLTLSGGNFALGANNLTMTGSLGATGARLTKGWFTDLEITNLPTINGGTLATALSLSSYELLSNKATTFGTVNDTLYPTVKAVNDAITSAVVGLLDYRGSYDASVNTFPASGGSGLIGAILKGDFWVCSVAGTLGGIGVTAGDLIIALVDTPAQTASNWDLVQHDVNSEYVTKALYDANSILYATTDNTPVALTVGASTIVGRKSTGNIVALTGAEALVISGGASLTTPTFVTSISTPSVLATANDSGALGASGTAFSDLFLASGGVINWAAANATITHSTGLLTINVPVDLGTSNALKCGTIELGHATANTLSASGGVLSIEGVNVLTVAGGTLTGSITLGENTSIALDPAGSADGKYSGITIAGTAGYAQTYGDLVYLAVADSRWEKTDADSTTTAYGLVGIVVVAGAADGNACTILLQGQIRADAAFPTLTVGAPVYLGETAGAIQVAIPTGADNVIRVVGFALTADEIYFNPSQDVQTTIA